MTKIQQVFFVGSLGLLLYSRFFSPSLTVGYIWYKYMFGVVFRGFQANCGTRQSSPFIRTITADIEILPGGVVGRQGDSQQWDFQR
ncbi:hypothetical protein HY224_01735 [Candidatus Uhrbacteria bacterium]|nr:hypothetical protein [Candidatus Uhrbacteria bacterium]